jgi:predicted nuclease of restriction endonuclease-like (RecB) superfamily
MRKLHGRLREILESAKTAVARSVNTTQVIANWLIGREIVEEEQHGKWRAEYGKQVLRELSHQLHTEYGNGYSVDNLELFRRFYRDYLTLISDAMPRNFRAHEKSDALRRKSDALLSDKGLTPIPYAPRKESWKPGELHPNLSWTHYRTLLRVDKIEVRSFYEIEAIKNNWGSTPSPVA